jgi:ubiquinone/menaquinone biosynthesis C-methylase UbiE
LQAAEESENTFGGKGYRRRSMKKKEYSVMFNVEDDHWWYVGLRMLVLSFMNSRCSGRENMTVLDAGCGTGGMLAECREYNTFGLDISEESMKFCSLRNLPNLSRGSVSALPFHDNSFDMLISLDVLYHLDVLDDTRALKEFYRVTNQGGLLMLNLPAYNFLRSTHDEIIHTRHRYTLRELRTKVESAGFAIDRITYRNTLLFPLAVVMRGIKKLFHRAGDAEASDLGPVPSFVNRLLTGSLALENRLIMRGVRFPFGLSVFCAARKRERKG